MRSTGQARNQKTSLPGYPGKGRQGQPRDTLVHAALEGFLSPGLALQALVDKGLVQARARSGLYVSEPLGATYLRARQRAQATA